VLSDGAASCIISADPQGFELLTVQQCTNHLARPIEMTNDSVRLMRYNAEGIRRASRAALGIVGIQSTEVSTLITNNLTQTVIEMFAAQCGVAFERVFLSNVASYGHVFAADGLINLSTITAKCGDRFLLALNGTCNWGAVLLRAINTCEVCQ
jgi:3-oxoacyl-[acyl-carrier-protein] synthase-3